MKFVIPVLIFCIFSISAFAETVCISDAKEYAVMKEKLPVLFQKLPLKLGGESPGRIYDVYATIKIDFVGNAIVLLTDSWQGPLGHYNNPAEVKTVCFDTVNSEMTISFKVKNTKDFTAFYTDKEVRLPEIVLKKISTAQEKSIIEKIYKKVPNKSMPIVESPTPQKEVN